MAMAFMAWFAACGPMACRVGQSTGARAWAAMSMATSRGLELLPILVRLLPRAIRSKKVFDMWSAAFFPSVFGSPVDRDSSTSPIMPKNARAAVAMC